jgi:hypothetical protein
MHDNDEKLAAPEVKGCLKVFEVSALRAVYYVCIRIKKDTEMSVLSVCARWVITAATNRKIFHAARRIRMRLRKRVHSAATQWSMHRCKIGCSCAAPIIIKVRFMVQRGFGSALGWKMTTADRIFGGGAFTFLCVLIYAN